MNEPTPPTARQAALVRATLAVALPQADRLAALFYARLFDLDPTARPLFLGDMTAQGRKLVDTLDVFAGDLERWDVMRAAARRMGARHATYGVRDAQYASVGEALLWTLGEALGEVFTPEARAAWETAYTLLAHEMRAGAAAVGSGG